MVGLRLTRLSSEGLQSFGQITFTLRHRGFVGEQGIFLGLFKGIGIISAPLSGFIILCFCLRNQTTLILASHSQCQYRSLAAIWRDPLLSDVAWWPSLSPFIFIGTVLLSGCCERYVPSGSQAPPHRLLLSCL